MRYTHIVRSNLNLLASFQVLIEERSVTRAANRMFLSQPAMSRVLDKLQDMFNDRLLIRTRKELEPTRRALQIYAQLEQALPAIETVLRGETFNSSESSDYFRIALTDNVALTLLPALMKAIAQQAPGIRIQIFALDDISFRKLETNALDLVISVHDAPSPLRSEPIYRDKYVCVIRKGHPLGKRPLTAKRYLQLEHLVISPTGTQHSLLERALTGLDYKRTARLTIPFFAAAGPIIESTDLAATLPGRLAQRLTAESKTRSVPLLIKLPDFRYIQIWHPRNHEDPAHVWLRELVRSVSAKGRGSR
jgi:LysR family transcriptional regulator, nod-box dependent transcriptional activator